VLLDRLVTTAACLLLVIGIAGCGEQSVYEPTDNLGTEVIPTAVSDEERARLLEEYLAAKAEAFGLDDPPKAEPIDLVSPSEWSTAQIACLRAAGINVSPTLDGSGVDFSQSGAADPRVARAAYLCEAQFPLDPKYLVPLNESQLRYVHNYLVSELIPCLEKHGQGVDSPPTVDQFLEKQGEWSPYVQLANQQSLEAVAGLIEVCPQSPPDEEIFPN
jgi:hypothetical protein